MPLVTSLLVLIVLARILGEIFSRLGHPTVVAEILAGVILGPALFNIVQPNPNLSGISELAVFLIVLQAGLEMDFHDVAKAFRGPGLLVAICGFTIPFIAGGIVGVIFEFDILRSIFLGLCMSITALPVAIRILENEKLLGTRMASFTVATAIVNDILALLILGVLLNIPSASHTSELSQSLMNTGVKIFATLVIVLACNWLVQRLRQRGFDPNIFFDRIYHSLGRETFFGLLIICVLVMSSFTEILGFHFVIGAFFGALLISSDLFGHKRFTELKQAIGTVSSGFLSPVFFAYIGLQLSTESLGHSWFLVTLLLVSIASKILSGWLGGKLVGIPSREAWGIGVLLNGRGIMELVVANIALDRGFIGKNIFSALVLMGIVTTVITPVMLRRFILPLPKLRASS